MNFEIYHRPNVSLYSCGLLRLQAKNLYVWLLCACGLDHRYSLMLQLNNVTHHPMIVVNLCRAKVATTLLVPEIISCIFFGFIYCLLFMYVCINPLCSYVRSIQIHLNIPIETKSWNISFNWNALFRGFVTKTHT